MFWFIDYLVFCIIIWVVCTNKQYGEQASISCRSPCSKGCCYTERWKEYGPRDVCKVLDKIGVFFETVCNGSLVIKVVAYKSNSDM